MTAEAELYPQDPVPELEFGALSEYMAKCMVNILFRALAGLYATISTPMLSRDVLDHAPVIPQLVSPEVPAPPTVALPLRLAISDQL